MKPIKWSKQARRDIERIADFMSGDIYPNVAAEIVAAARFVASTPKAGPLTGSKSDRKWPVKRFPYLLIYRLAPEGIMISRIVHSKADWQQFV
ncbi:MAG: type II toxin-antitoxin system RelE/ParE family toxin [Sphingomonadales bacterium]|nr:type II toxin-antitoxin system RelE/ParE family toxin [Sphingomonadales bacterium]MBK9002414.1 type II toxin-antitoxin system RelE/ParE family toxin [Sphingomonadales bacterium]MBK9267644.1 type II toxin-antitoxin system RelE/ParE family toxin [Sphingomonadales bacterium]MBP6435631.1 type II toxin-antitoxin system RelE/ParE family toxin [Sphingorhabdus sp.]